MAVLKRILGQSSPGATTPFDLYTVPSGKQTTISSVVVCNRSPTQPLQFRLSAAPSGAAEVLAQELFYDVQIEPRDSFIAVLGITLAATDKVRGQSNLANASFSLFGAEEDL